MKAWQREDFLQYFNSEWASNVDIENGRFNTVNTMASLMDYLRAESMRVKTSIEICREDNRQERRTEEKFLKKQKLLSFDDLFK